MALFGGQRDTSLFKKINRELMGDIISQQCSFYKYQVGKTRVNIYGEASDGRYFTDPVIFNALIVRQDQEYPESDLGVDFKWGIEFRFLRADLVDANVVINIGDIILYQERYYGVDSVVTNQYFVGKNPDYPNNVNPLNPGLEDFGSNLSVICNTYYIPADKVAISPYKERF